MIHSKRVMRLTPATMKTPRMIIAPRMPQNSTLRWYRRAMPSEPKTSRKTKRLSMLSDSSMRYPARYCCAASAPYHRYTRPEKPRPSEIHTALQA